MSVLMANGAWANMSGDISNGAMTQTLPSGMIIKAGYGVASAQPALSTDVPVGGTNVFPVAFPNSCFGGIGIHAGGSANVNGSLSSNIILSSVKSPTTTDITFISGWSAPIAIFYIAFGY